MKRSYNGWIARDANSDLYVGVKKPKDDGGIWIEFGNNMQMEESEFPGITYENSPQKVVVTIEDAPEKYKEEYTVDSRLSQVIADLPCIVATYKGCINPNRYYYIFQWSGFKTLVEEGDVIALKENGEWIVRSR